MFQWKKCSGLREAMLCMIMFVMFWPAKRTKNAQLSSRDFADVFLIFKC